MIPHGPAESGAGTNSDRARLNELTAVVTGAGRGIGAQIVRSFAREGAEVWALSRSMPPMEPWRGHPRIRPLVVDVTNAAAVAGAASAVERTDVLVNCAGLVPLGVPLLQCGEEALKASLDGNLFAAYRVIRSFLPSMLLHGGGSIINIASVVSSVAAARDRFAYGTAKAALIGLTKSVALDYLAYGVRCNAVCPGTVQTPGLEERIAASPDPEEERAAYTRRHKLGRFGRPLEIAELCVYLASPAGAFMTGQVLVVDGGMTL